MRILIDISHPAHVHFFRNAMGEWRKHGHEVHVVSRKKDLTLDLLLSYGIPNKCLSQAGKGIPRLLLELAVHEARLLRETSAFKPDILLQISGLFISHVGFLLGVPTITFTDTEMARLSNAIAFPFTSAVVTPSCYEGPVPPSKHYLYPGYHELAYLHPRRFTPDPRVLRDLGLNRGDPFYILRFVSWGAVHDVGESGFSYAGKSQLVRMLASRGKVFISSEGKLPGELEPFRLPIPPQRIHHAMAFAELCVGESATMASESAVLGVPSVFVSTSSRGYTNEEEKVYGLVRNFSHRRQEDALQAVEDLLGMKDSREVWQEKRARLLRDKIDVTDWLVRLVEGYPDSLREFCTRPCTPRTQRVTT